jgi:hypothetical protein
MTRPDSVSVSLRPALYDKAATLAKDRGVTIPQLLRSLLEEAPLPSERRAQ